MICSLVPKQRCRNIYSIDLDALEERGVKVIFADLDNTLARYGQLEPSVQLRLWMRRLEEHGIRLFVLSNSRKATRADQFCRSLGVPYLKHAGKPKRAGFQKALEQNGVTPAQAAMVGDQIFTDVLGGNRARVHTILIHPIALDSLPRILRYGFETPFRLLCQNREGWK